MQVDLPGSGVRLALLDVPQGRGSCNTPEQRDTQPTSLLSHFFYVRHRAFYLRAQKQPEEGADSSFIFFCLTASSVAWMSYGVWWIRSVSRLYNCKLFRWGRNRWFYCLKFIISHQAGNFVITLSDPFHRSASSNNLFLWTCSLFSRMTPGNDSFTI